MARRAFRLFQLDDERAWQQGRNGNGYAHPTDQEEEEDEEEEEAPKARTSSDLAMSKVIGVFMIMEHGSCIVEKGSIYGAAILMPQLARSMKWQRHMVIEAIRSYLFVVVSISLQVGLLMMLLRDELVMDGFAGQMYLCDLGAWCRGGNEPGCTGPAGTEIKPSRLYEFDVWSTRIFVKEAFKKLFPDQKDLIEEVVDPGEYGMESWWCRVLCCFLFMMAMLVEAGNIKSMIRTLWYIPTASESWIADAQSQDGDEGPQTISVRKSMRFEERWQSAASSSQMGNSWIEECELKIAGMPAFWKCMNVIVVLLPKMTVWYLTCASGILFLMETAGIENLVVNSIALSFVLSIDEMVCETLTSEATHLMLAKCKEFSLFDVDEITNLRNDEICERYGEQYLNQKFRCVDLVVALFPIRIIEVAVITCFFALIYYHRNCEWSDGASRYLPKPLHVPTSTALSLLNILLPSWFPVDVSSDAIWKMPDSIE
eukprot:TRINITY_DN41260_c0_g1_i1.p1 TRINITY_DN41260_c0_g1~~TRINITY_DN41260_c0_g1_i1.p1  ORF type:complete len:485 (-),score=87.34 TRINITY_DN41260_c0_g1_i1:80-1534(-)